MASKQFNANRNALHAHNCTVTIAITLKKAYSVVGNVMAETCRTCKQAIHFIFHARNVAKTIHFIIIGFIIANAIDWSERRLYRLRQFGIWNVNAFPLLRVRGMHTWFRCYWSWNGGYYLLAKVQRFTCTTQFRFILKRTQSSCICTHFFWIRI